MLVSGKAYKIAFPAAYQFQNDPPKQASGLEPGADIRTGIRVATAQPQQK